MPLAALSAALVVLASGDLREAARAYALEHRAELGLGPSSSLGPAQAFSTRFGGSVHFAQLVDGVEVDGARVIVTVDVGGRVVRVASSARPFGEPAKLDWRLGAAAAMRAAAAQVDGALYRTPEQPFGGWVRRVFVSNGALRAGYLVWIPTWKDDENWHLAIDAADGAVLWRENRVHRSFDADVYASDPGGLTAGIGVTPLTRVTLGNFKAGTDGGRLEGQRASVMTCCPAAGCDFDAGAAPRRSVGLFRPTTSTALAYYDVAVCDLAQRATNAGGSYVYTPVDPPIGAAPNMQSPADVDEFSEVHAYHHVNKAYDFIRSLSLGPLAADGGFSPFTLRDEKAGRSLQVHVNTSYSVYPSAANAQGVWYGTGLRRDDDARFFPREEMHLLLPEHASQSDAIRLAQGNGADFAYDGPTVWHEFGHAVVYSTAHWLGPTEIDARSGNDESGALNEGVADAFAFMLGNDPVLARYTAPRGQPSRPYARTADNQLKCPDDLWGLPHDDSQPFSGALWEARSQHFQGSDQGRTFDAAFYAAVVSFPPDVGFEKAARIVVDAMALAFPSMPNARSLMTQLFTQRGVLGCSKVRDVTLAGGVQVFVITSTTAARLPVGQTVPGPYQMLLRMPNGATSIRINGSILIGNTGLRVLAKVGSPITFKRATGSRITHDADRNIGLSFVQGAFTATVPLEVPCGQDLYLALVNTGNGEQVLYNISVTPTAPSSCPPPVVPDAGEPDAGVVVDAGIPPAVIGDAAPPELGAADEGCGCGQAPGALALVLLAALLRARRRSSS